MIFWIIFAAVYALVAVFATYMTHQEQQRQEHPSVMFNMLGYLVCAFWPIGVLVALIAAATRPATFTRAELE